MLGTTVGSYRISHELARGGMGVVYVARHDIMDRDAVVKVLHPRFSHDKAMVSRFFNEARAAASVEHPGIVEIFDVGYADNQAFIIMERLRGQTLSDRLAKKPLAARESVALVRQITGALGAAHARGIVHRDLKPDNIFIVEDPEVPGGERVKLLDFGIAKLAEPRDGVMTAQGSLFGTPAYMSPEQCSDAATVDHRADLYAVGCILYQCLAGQPPFGTGGIELLAAHLRDRPRPVRERVPAIPADLDALTARLLEKAPDDRYSSCKELIAALDALRAEDLPTEAPVLDLPASVAPTLASDADLNTPPAGVFGTDPTIAQTGSTDADMALSARTEAGDVSLQPTLAQTIEPTSEPTSEQPGNGATDPTLAASDPDIRPAVASDTSPALVEGRAGSVDGRAPTDARSYRPGRARWLLAALLLVTLACVVGGWVMFRSARTSSSASAPVEPALPSSTPTGVPATPIIPNGADARAALERAERAMADRRWTDAIAAAGQVPAGTSEKAAAEDIMARATREITNQSHYEQFLAALQNKKLQTAWSQYRKLPEDSTYRALAEPAATEARDAWLARKVRKANKYRQTLKCKKIVRIGEDIAKQGEGAVFDQAAAQIKELSSVCAERKQLHKDAAKVRDFDQRNANAILKSMKSAFAACIKAGSTNGARRSGTLSVRVHIAASGKVRLVGSAYPDRNVRQCISRIGKGLSFPPSKQGGIAHTTVFYRP